MQIIGISVTDNAIMAVARRGTRPEVVEWAGRVLRRHVRREPSLLVRIKDRSRLEAAMKADGIPDEACARIRVAFDAKEPVYTSSRQALSAFLSKAADTMDWIESLPESDRRIRRIDRMAWTDAEKLAEAWHASLAKARKASKGIMDGAKKLVDLDGGAFAAELTTKGALQAEGKAMGHCVGGYWNRVASEATRIVSIRDPEGQPHVTIELSKAPELTFEDGGSIRASHSPYNGVDIVACTEVEWTAVQVRGKRNRPPVPRYAGLVAQWLGMSGIPWVEFGERRHVPSHAAVKVYTAYKKHFRNADTACDFAEAMFQERLDEKEGRKASFRMLYVQSGLEAIHREVGRERVVAFMEAIVPRLIDDLSNRVAKGSQFGSAIRTSGLGAVLDNIEGVKDDIAVLSKLYDSARTLDPVEATCEEKVLAAVPGGQPLRVVIHSVPLMPLFLLSSGYADGLEARVLADTAPHLRATADAITKDPCAIHVVRAVRGELGDTDIRKGFLFCGLAPEFAVAAASVEQALSSYISEAKLALRRARSSGNHRHEVINVATNLLAEGYAQRLRTRVEENLRGEFMLLSATERALASKPIIRPREEPAIRHYRLPR